MGAVESVVHERDFKVLCDGLLRFELGALVQTFASPGADGGVDALFDGPISGISGRWVFQYKFRSPSISVATGRSWLKTTYCGGPQGQRPITSKAVKKGKSKTGEFDKPGIRGACGYVLLTNVPMTTTLLRHITGAWVAAGHPNAPFCVWDPSRLNALIKGREHLARSWSGEKEARCLDAIIKPLWGWLSASLAPAAHWIDDPLWPVRASPYSEKRLLTSGFRPRLDSVYGFRLTSSDASLDMLMSDPQFSYARDIAFPRAMEPLGDVSESVKKLAESIFRHVDAMRDVILKRMPQLEERAPGRHVMVARILAYCVLARQWGFTDGVNHISDDGHLYVGGTVCLPDVQLDGVEPLLDVLVNEATHGEVPRDVRAGRLVVAENLARWWERLWYPVELRIDAE